MGKARCAQGLVWPRLGVAKLQHGQGLMWTRLDTSALLVGFPKGRAGHVKECGVGSRVLVGVR
jgi:hypothetical protein